MRDAGLPEPARRAARRTACDAAMLDDRRPPAAPGPQARRQTGPRRTAARRLLPLDRPRPADREGGGERPTTPAGRRPGREVKCVLHRPAAGVARRSSASGCRRRRRSRSSAPTRSARRPTRPRRSCGPWSSAASAALAFALEVSIGIAVLLIVVAISYRQICIAYPTGGGSYSVSKRNFGRRTSLVAASALMIDYVMTVAVSTSSAVEQIVSAFPGLHDERVLIGVAAIALHHDRQPPRTPRGRQHLRCPDLPVRRLGAVDDRHRDVPDRRPWRGHRPMRPSSRSGSAIEAVSVILILRASRQVRWP